MLEQTRSLNKEDAIAQYIKKTNELNVFVNSSTVAMSDSEKEEAGEEEDDDDDGEESKTVNTPMESSTPASPANLALTTGRQTVNLNS